LIINADDFGYDEGVVRGITDCHQAGVISSTSCMTNMPAWPLAAAYLRDHPELGAGVHLVFNDGRPLLPPARVPALVNASGGFLDDAHIQRGLRPGTTSQLRVTIRKITSLYHLVSADIRINTSVIRAPNQCKEGI
jgi:hypothetical protein